MLKVAEFSVGGRCELKCEQVATDKTHECCAIVCASVCARGHAIVLDFTYLFFFRVFIFLCYNYYYFTIMSVRL